MMNKIFTELNKCVILITVTCTLFSCKKQKNNDLDLWKESRLTGFLLEEYKINDWKLDSITVDFVKWQKRTNHNLDKRIPTMYILACPDSMNCVINDKNGKKKYIDVLAYPPDTYYFAFIGEYKTDIYGHLFSSLSASRFSATQHMTVWMLFCLPTLMMNIVLKGYSTECSKRQVGKNISKTFISLKKVRQEFTTPFI